MILVNPDQIRAAIARLQAAGLVQVAPPSTKSVQAIKARYKRMLSPPIGIANVAVNKN